jgi:hypothetical protein
MAKVESTTISTTAACDTGRCGSCRGVVFSLTTAHLSDCTHGCHLNQRADELLEDLDQLADEIEALEDDQAEILIDRWEVAC